MYEKIWNNILNENKVMQLIKKELIERGYSENIVIEKHLMDNNIIVYYVFDVIRYHGKDTKTLSIINFNQVKEILKNIYEKNDNSVRSIRPIIKENRVDYQVFYTTNVKRLEKSR